MISSRLSVGRRIRQRAPLEKATFVPLAIHGLAT
jgi:hypothetical protein